jgi:hypothetical protein
VSASHFVFSDTLYFIQVLSSKAHFFCDATFLSADVLSESCYCVVASAWHFVFSGSCPILLLVYYMYNNI